MMALQRNARADPTAHDQRDDPEGEKIEKRRIRLNLQCVGTIRHIEQGKEQKPASAGCKAAGEESPQQPHHRTLEVEVVGYLLAAGERRPDGLQLPLRYE